MNYPLEKKLAILGGGQLGRMALQEAANLNLHVSILDPAADAPCAGLTPHFTAGDLNDYEAVMAFATDADVVSVEIENVSTEALTALEAQGKEVYPKPEHLRLIQDKRLQKEFYQKNNFPTSAFTLTENREDVKKLADRLPFVHKLGRGGYDGRGVQVLRTEAELENAFDAPGLIEDLVDIDKELSVIVARNASGEMATFPLVECVFHPEHNLVRYLIAPADVSEALEKEAADLAKRLVETLDFVGLLAIELFLTPSGELLVNEVAPRPHNSGHQSIEGNYTSQFGQFLRAVMGLPLGDTAMRCPSAMVNLLGEPGHTGSARYQGLDRALALPGVYPHLYGKATTKPHRKMGHVTVVADSREALLEKIQFLEKEVKVVSQ
jgi:5-(carboxyamino)imidazole ribonucleotide synthase